jgi:hypothetical protein
VTSTLFSTRSDAAAASDFRALSEKQLIAAAKRGERASFGELCERHLKQVFWVTRRIDLPARPGAGEFRVNKPAEREHCGLRVVALTVAETWFAARRSLSHLMTRV